MLFCSVHHLFSHVSVGTRAFERYGSTSVEGNGTASAAVEEMKREGERNETFKYFNLESS